MKKVLVVLALAFIVLAYGLVGGMDRRMREQEEAWQNSVQALELEQEKVMNDIIDLQGRYEKLEGDVMSQGILIYDIRDRLHFTLFEDLELGVDW